MSSGARGGRTRRRSARSPAAQASTTAKCTRDAEQLPGLVIFRFDAPLFFANARTFRDQIRALAAAEPRPRWILIAAEPITDVDTTAADMLAELDDELNEAGTALVFAELKHPVREKLERYELIGPLDPKHFFPTLDAALDEFRRQTDVDWTAPSPTGVGLD
jgi:MFS superfamily sulfate permease-like transporter